MSDVRRKVDLYILSLALLFVFFIIITVDIPMCFGEGCGFVGAKELAQSNVVTIISVLLLLYCIYAYKRFSFDSEGATDINFEVKKIEGINYEHLTFLATYVVPLVSFDFGSSRQMVVLALLLIVMGAIYVKTDLFYANPSLALLGFHIYQADGNFKDSDDDRENIILICRGRLEKGQIIPYKKLDDRIYFVKGVK